MAYTTPRTWVAGEYPTAAQMNANVRDNISFLANPPACRVFHNATISHTTSAAWQTLTFNSERFDTAAMHDTATNNPRITFTVGGLYLIGGHVEFAAHATGMRGLRIQHSSGVTLAATHNAAVTTAGVSQHVLVTTVAAQAAGQYVVLDAWQNSGGALSIFSAAASTPEFWAVWVGLG